jgi:PAS domain S-box-containing protein
LTQLLHEANLDKDALAVKLSALAAAGLLVIGWFWPQARLAWWLAAVILAVGPLLRHMARSALRERKTARRVAGLLANTPDAVIEMDPKLRVIAVNPAAETLLGQTRSTLVGRTIEDLAPLCDLLPFQSLFHDALKTAGQLTGEAYSAPCARWLTALAFRSDDGVTVLLRDVTAQRGTDEALRREIQQRRRVEQRFEAALSVNPLVVFNLDHELRYTWVYNNQVAWRDLEIIGKTPADLFETDTAPRLSNLFQTVMATGTSRRAELALRPLGLDHDLYFVTSAKPVLNAEGRVVGLTGASFDITQVVLQRQELARAREEAVLAKAEAERASLSRSKFLAAASHDLRQPVQSLLLLIAVLKERLAGTAADRVVDNMEESVDALCLLLDSMLDISKLDAGIIVPSLETVALGRLLARLAGEYRLRAAEQNLDFHYVPTSISARTDPFLLERVLRNLIENALRYCPSGRVIVGCRRMGAAVRIDIIDTGIGIPEAQLEPIFDEFHQVGNTGRDRAQGLGLGLAIVRRIMRLLGGTVEVASVVGRGSRFSITLPQTLGVEGTPTPAAALAEGAGHAVLIIEDDAILRGSLRIMLEDWGFRPELASTGEEAVALVAGGSRPALIVSDYRLTTEMSGIDAVSRIRALLGLPIPSLIVTGDTAPERITEVHSSGFRILHKPVAAVELRRALSDMLREIGTTAETTQPSH